MVLCTDSKNDIQSKLQNLCNKADIKVLTVTQTMDKISGMTKPEFRFEFEVGSAFSPFQLYKITKITLSAGESKVLLNPEVCVNYGVHRECLKLLNGRSGTMNLTADVYCSCSLARSTGGPSTKARSLEYHRVVHFWNLLPGAHCGKVSLFRFSSFFMFIMAGCCHRGA